MGADGLACLKDQPGADGTTPASCPLQRPLDDPCVADGLVDVFAVSVGGIIPREALGCKEDGDVDACPVRLAAGYVHHQRTQALAGAEDLKSPFLVLGKERGERGANLGQILTLVQRPQIARQVILRPVGQLIRSPGQEVDDVKAPHLEMNPTSPHTLSHLAPFKTSAIGCSGSNAGRVSIWWRTRVRS